MFAGLTAILAKVGVKDVDSNLATAVRTSVILVFAWLAAWISNRQPLSSLTPRNWVFLALSGLATGASWLCYFRALQLGEASKVAPVDKLSVVVAMALAVVFLGESLSWLHWLGGALIVAGAGLLARARRAAAAILPRWPRWDEPGRQRSGWQGYHANHLCSPQHGEGKTMTERELGRSGLWVSAVGLGCMGMSEFYDPAQMDDAESFRVIHRY